MSEHIIISDTEFKAMEQLLAGLLSAAGSASEEAAILGLHARLVKIYERSTKLSMSKHRLLSKRQKSL